jgi:hypothetical protein
MHALMLLIAAANEHPENLAYNLGARFVADALSMKKRPKPDDEAAATVEEAKPEPRENRRYNPYKSGARGPRAPQPTRRSRPRKPLSVKQQAYFDEISSGPAYIVRQAVVAAAAKSGGSLRSAFKAALAALTKRGLVEVSTGAMRLTEKGEGAEQKLKRTLAQDKNSLRSLSADYLALVRAEKLRKKITASMVERLNGMVAMTPPPDLSVTPPPRDNPTGYALSGRVKTRRVFDPELNEEADLRRSRD